jgi:hypothetical protein
MIGTAILAALALVGIATIATILGMWLVSYERPPACRCGQWLDDPDSGLALPFLDLDMLHDRRLCQPWQECTTETGNPRRLEES